MATKRGNGRTTRKAAPPQVATDRSSLPKVLTREEFLALAESPSAPAAPPGDEYRQAVRDVFGHVTAEGNPVLLRLRKARHAHEQATRELEEAAAAARAQGVSWHRIGLVLGLTSEGARKRYGR